MKLNKIILSAFLTVGFSSTVFSATGSFNEKEYIDNCSKIMKDAAQKELQAAEQYLKTAEKFDKLVSLSSSPFQGIESCLQSALQTGMSFSGSVPGLSAITGQIVQQVGNAATNACNSAVSAAKGKINDTLNQYSLSGDKVLGGFGKGSDNMFGSIIGNAVGSAAGNTKFGVSLK